MARWLQDDIDIPSLSARNRAAWARAEASRESAAAAQPSQGLHPVQQPRPPVPRIYPLVGLCRAAGLPEPVPEYRFHPLRKWRFDYAFPLHRVAVEIDGGLWTQGRHNRAAGYIADMEKLNAAALLGFRVLRYTPQQLNQAIADLRIMLAGEDA